MIDVRYPATDRTAGRPARRPGPGRLSDLGRRGRRRGWGQRQGHPGDHHDLRGVRLERPRHALPQSDLRQGGHPASLQHRLGPGRQAGRPARDRHRRRHRRVRHPRQHLSPTASAPTASSGTPARSSSGSPSSTTPGLNLEDPGIHNGLSGTMVVKGDHFQVNGIPVVPVDDALAWNPYQVADITVRDSGTNAVLVQTRATVPTSDEINCGEMPRRGPAARRPRKTRRRGGDDPGRGPARAMRLLPRQSGARPDRARILRQVPVPGHPRLPLIARARPATTATPARPPSAAAASAHTAADGNCVVLPRDHGRTWPAPSPPAAGSPGSASLCARPATLGSPRSIRVRRSTGTPTGHNGLSCPACHGSPHAQVPTNQASGRLSGRRSTRPTVVPIGTCKVCHDTSKGEGIEEFGEAHGGTRATACRVCHTAGPAADGLALAAPVPVEEPLS
ncbi:MAG: hypothetical protein M0C28_06995 [Candidatus Moduliflexus flocculans]|nr:hypothetical protein [Candidatus Moduliflexus flocculans]